MTLRMADKISAKLGHSPIERLEFMKAALPNLKPTANKQTLLPEDRRRVKTIVDEIDFRDGVALTDVEDSMHVMLPAGCKLQQIAIRQNVPVPNSKRFLIDKKLWGALAPRDRAGLILHEIIYEHFF